MLLAAALSGEPSPPRVQAVSVGATWCAPCKFQRKDCEKITGISVGETANCQIRFVYEDKTPAPFAVEVYPTTRVMVDGVMVQEWKGQTSALTIAGAMLREQAKLLEGGK